MVVSFMPWYQLRRMLDEPQTWTVRFEEKNLLPNLRSEHTAYHSLAKLPHTYRFFKLTVVTVLQTKINTLQGAYNNNLFTFYATLLILFQMGGR